MSSDLKDLLICVIGLPLIVILLIGVIFLGVSPFLYYESCQEAKIFNQINGTDYTCWDFFWSSNQINKQTQTIKIDGKIGGLK